MKRPSLRFFGLVSVVAIVLSVGVGGVAAVVKVFAGTSHGVRSLPPDRPVVVFDVERVDLVERWVFLNVAYPGKRVRLTMPAMRPSAYPVRLRSALAASSEPGRLYAVLEVKRARDATCCSRIFDLVEHAAPLGSGRLAIPVDTSYWKTYPYDPAHPGRLDSLWFADVSEFDVDDAEARSLVARDLVGKPAIVTVDVSDPERLFVSDIRAKT